jgi:adenylosuccinate lyase
MDLQQIVFTRDNLKLLGCKGATGTSASFLTLFNGEHDKVLELERKINVKLGFESSYPVCGQTYPRKVDFYTLSALSGIAQSAMKFSSDIRLLSHLKEVEEPFEDTQVGSSAMPYKRNPMRCERIASLSRYLMVDAFNPALTAGAQWLERTLDDSANRRISIPEAFLCADAILSLYINVLNGLTVNPKVIQKHLDEELPFMATETILMHCVKKGGDRQLLHGKIREHSMAALSRIKEDGESNDLIDRILADEAFALTSDELRGLLDAGRFTGRAGQQTEEFMQQVGFILHENKDLIGVKTNITV